MNERITPYDPELAKSITKEGQRIVRELNHALEDKISMNERIKELKDQCWVEKRWTVVQDNGMWIEKHIDQEKFAELIVRECAELATKEYNNRSSIHGNDLLKHFGVEE